jgi:hypothetical protein
VADLDVTLDPNQVDATLDPAAIDVELDPNAVDATIAPDPLHIECDPLNVCLCIGAPHRTHLVTSVNLLTGDLVTVNTVGQLVLADADHSTGYYDVIGTSVGNYTAGTTATIAIGVVTRVPVRFAVAPAIGTIGDNVFLSPTAGLGQLTPPTPGGRVVVLLGTLAQADGSSTTVDVWFRPQVIGRI